jgi:hypothetical protein
MMTIARHSNPAAKRSESKEVVEGRAAAVPAAALRPREPRPEVCLSRDPHPEIGDRATAPSWERCSTLIRARPRESLLEDVLVSPVPVRFIRIRLRPRAIPTMLRT